MIRFFLILTITCFSAVSLQAAGSCCDEDGYSHSIVINGTDHSFVKHFNDLGDYDLDIDGGDVYLLPRHGRIDEIRITSDNRVFVDHRECDLDEDGHRLAGEIHELGLAIEDDAREIAREGAKIGVAGAKLGISAIANVIRLISPDYDSEDLEREMEYKSQKIEAKADALEAKADMLEEKADILEERADELLDKIRDLDSEERY